MLATNPAPGVWLELVTVNHAWAFGRHDDLLGWGLSLADRAGANGLEGRYVVRGCLGHVHWW